MLKKFICLLIYMLIINSSKAETLYVKVPVLNLRSCANADCNIIKKLNKGTNVEIIKTSGAWAEIKTDKIKGFVIKNSLKKDPTSQWIFWIVLIIIISILFNGLKNRCIKCKKWWTLEEIERECIDKIKSNITKATYTHYKNHTRKREYIVPATIYEYKITKKCKHCGHIKIEYERNKIEN